MQKDVQCYYATALTQSPAAGFVAKATETPRTEQSLLLLPAAFGSTSAASVSTGCPFVPTSLGRRDGGTRGGGTRDLVCVSRCAWVSDLAGSKVKAPNNFSSISMVWTHTHTHTKPTHQAVSVSTTEDSVWSPVKQHIHVSTWQRCTTEWKDLGDVEPRICGDHCLRTSVFTTTKTSTKAGVEGGWREGGWRGEGAGKRVKLMNSYSRATIKK